MTEVQSSTARVVGKAVKSALYCSENTKSPMRAELMYSSSDGSQTGAVSRAAAAVANPSSNARLPLLFRSTQQKI